MKGGTKDKKFIIKCQFKDDKKDIVRCEVEVKNTVLSPSDPINLTQLPKEAANLIQGQTNDAAKELKKVNSFNNEFNNIMKQFQTEFKKPVLINTILENIKKNPDIPIFNLNDKLLKFIELIKNIEKSLELVKQILDIDKKIIKKIENIIDLQKKKILEIFKKIFKKIFEEWNEYILNNNNNNNNFYYYMDLIESNFFIFYIKIIQKNKDIENKDIDINEFYQNNILKYNLIYNLTYNQYTRLNKICIKCEEYLKEKIENDFFIYCLNIEKKFLKNNLYTDYLLNLNLTEEQFIELNNFFDNFFNFDQNNFYKLIQEKEKLKTIIDCFTKNDNNDVFKINFKKIKNLSKINFEIFYKMINDYKKNKQNGGMKFNNKIKKSYLKKRNFKKVKLFKSKKKL